MKNRSLGYDCASVSGNQNIENSIKNSPGHGCNGAVWKVSYALGEQNGSD